MKHSTSRTRRAAIAVIGLTLATPLYAHKEQRQDTGSGGQMGPGMMRDMAAQMKQMSGQMMQGGMSSNMQKGMAERMQEMGGMMDKMSGIMGKGAMTDADNQQQMEQMRKRMDEMMKQ